MHPTRPHPNSIFARIVEPQRFTPNGRLEDGLFSARCPAPLPDGQRFALLTDVAGAKPIAADTLRELAQVIHRRRGPDALRLSPERFRFKDQVRDAVAVHADELASDGAATGRSRLIGHAWIDGRDWRCLEAALDTHTPSRRA